MSADSTVMGGSDSEEFVALAESDLLGVPWKVVFGNHFRETGEVELETRDGDTRYVDLAEVADVVD